MIVNNNSIKIKTISRTEEDYVRKTKLDITKVFRNRDPSLHPFERSREYTRALVATKLDKIFAKPFIASLDGHRDGVYCGSSIRNKVVPYISGACDGEVKVWDLSRRVCVWSAYAHKGFVRGIAPDTDGTTFFTCGDDKLIKQWSLLQSNSSNEEIEPMSTVLAPHALTSIDHHWNDKQYATSGESVCIWDSSKGSNTPTLSYKWGADSILSVKFNPSEACLLASTGSDRSVCLYDLRAAVPMKKFYLKMKSNKVVWNPMEPFNFALANEDHNVYSFDMRYLDKALLIHKDNTSAVMDINFSPTGREFATAGYDRTIRIFNSLNGRSRDLYHTKRMQRLFCINYSTDSQFLLSGSDDTNIRIWKVEASKPLGVNAGRKERKERYLDTLKNKYKQMPEIKRISSDVKVPKYLRKAKKTEQIQLESEHRKFENRKRHSAKGEVTLEPERKRAVIKID
eukprot:gene20414-26492_t